MYDNKTLKVQSTRETLFPCVCCVCVLRAWCVCVVRAAHFKTDKQRTLLSFGGPNDQSHKTCKKKNSRLEEYSLKYSLYLKVNEQLGENCVCQFLS